MSTASRALACCCLAATALTALTTLLAGDSWNGADIRRAATAEPIAPLPLEVHLDRRKVELGQRLFLDARLSRDNTVSCASCHGLQTVAHHGAPDGRTRGPHLGGVRVKLLPVLDS